MELKRYVLDTERCFIYDLTKEADVKKFEMISKFATHFVNGAYKTSDNILELVEVGDLVKLHREHTLYVVKESKKVNIIVEDMYGENQTVRKIYIQVLWKLQYNGDYKRYPNERT